MSSIRTLALGFLGALLAVATVNAPRAYAQAISSGGVSTSQILAALVGQSVSAASYTATASSGSGFSCSSALGDCVSLGPGSKAKIGSNSSGEILIGDNTTGAATYRLGELTFYGNGWIQSNGLYDCNHGCRFRNAYTNEPLRFDEPDGVKIYDSEATGSTTLGTCGTAAGNVEPKTIKDDPTAGGTSGHRDRLCRCTSDGAATPAYAWVNLTSGTVGTATTCSD